MKYTPRSLLSTALLEDITYSEQAKNSTNILEFFSLYSKSAPEGFLERCIKVWENEGVFSIPQPGLRKNREFGLNDDPDSSKKISSSFDKRVLRIPKVFEDNPTPFPPSVPFGYRDKT